MAQQSGRQKGLGQAIGQMYGGLQGQQLGTPKLRQVLQEEFVTNRNMKKALN